MNSTTSDIFGKVAEQAIEPLTTWGWIWHTALLLIVLALSVFAGIVLAHQYSPATWITAAFFAWFTSAPLLGMLRAVGPGVDTGWLVIMGSIFVVVALYNFLAIKLYGSRTPNPALGVGAPVVGVGFAALLDSISERLSTIPLSWSSAVVITVVIVVALIAMVASQD